MQVHRKHQGRRKVPPAVEQRDDSGEHRQQCEEYARHDGEQALAESLRVIRPLPHPAEYVRGDIHTNSVEGVFSLLKRGIIGTFHHVSKGHLHRYCDECSFKYNTRTALGYTDSSRAAAFVLATEGKRLTYK